MATEEGAADGRPGLLSELEEYCFDTGGFVVIRSGAHNHRPPPGVGSQGGGIRGGAGSWWRWVGPGFVVIHSGAQAPTPGAQGTRGGPGWGRWCTDGAVLRAVLGPAELRAAAASPAELEHHPTLVDYVNRIMAFNKSGYLDGAPDGPTFATDLRPEPLAPAPGHRGGGWA
eukprot:COSAG04_NODE_7041_length_1204_cov_1.489593_1_plen_170_part_10